MKVEPDESSEDHPPVSQAPEEHGRETEVVRLRSALRALKPVLGQIGLIPSRMCPYIPIPDSDADPNQQQAYDHLRTICLKVVQFEINQPRCLSVSNMAAEILADDMLDQSAPPLLLPCFMHVLHLTNPPADNYPNDGAWKVHDILKLFSAYLPLHTALLDFLSAQHGDQTLRNITDKLLERGAITHEKAAGILKDLQSKNQDLALIHLLVNIYSMAMLNVAPSGNSTSSQDSTMAGVSAGISESHEASMVTDVTRVKSGSPVDSTMTGDSVGCSENPDESIVADVPKVNSGGPEDGTLKNVSHRPKSGNPEKGMMTDVLKGNSGGPEDGTLKNVSHGPKSGNPEKGMMTDVLEGSSGGPEEGMLNVVHKPNSGNLEEGLMTDVPWVNSRKYEDDIKNVVPRGNSGRPEDNIMVAVPSGNSGSPEESPMPGWLRQLLESVEMCEEGEQKVFRNSLPQTVLLLDTWTNVYEQLLSPKRHRADRNQTDEAQSEAGDSDLSESATIINNNINNNDLQKPDSAHTKLLDFANLLGEQSLEETKHQRTAEFVSRSDTMSSVEFIDHEYTPSQPQHRDRTASADDSRSEVTQASGSSVSTENNNHYTDQSNDPAIRSLTRTLHYTGLSSGPQTKSGTIRLKAFQEEALTWARQGSNVAIFLPTGTGKTFIVLRYVQDLMSRSQADGKTVRVAFLAPKVKLAEQQYGRFLHYFPGITYIRTGRKRTSNAPLKELYSSYKVFVMTPMCLVETIGSKEASITDFSLIVLDECHHTINNQDFKKLMDVYMDAKFSTDDPALPQVIGLTASPGAGRGGSVEEAITHIRQLCFNMDVARIGTVKEYTAEMEESSSKPKHEIHTCEKRKLDGFKQIIEGMMKEIEEQMLQLPYIQNHPDVDDLKRSFTAPDLHRGTLRYTHWLSRLFRQLVFLIDDKDVYTKIYSRLEMLQRYQECLVLNEDCESFSALDNLKKLMEDVEVADHFKDSFKARLPSLQRACSMTEDFNPKLKMLEDILLTMQEKQQLLQERCSCMVFVRTIILSQVLKKWIENHEDLKSLKPGRIIGNNKKTVMTSQEISDVLDKFNKGDHQLVVCTSAAEEGLDFQACNLVIRYDHVTSMTAMIQTRGRARHKNSQYSILGDQTQRSADREKNNMAAENMMNQAISLVQEDMNTNQACYITRMRNKQKDEWEIRKQAAETTCRKRALLEDSTTVYHLLCRKCHSYACSSSDLRLLAPSNRLVVDTDFRRRYERVELKKTERFQNRLEKVAQIYCSVTDGCSKEWGCVIRHTPSNAEHPLLKLDNFFILNADTGKKVTTENGRPHRWTNCPFNVREITHNELENMAASTSR